MKSGLSSRESAATKAESGKSVVKSLIMMLFIVSALCVSQRAQSAEIADVQKEVMATNGLVLPIPDLSDSNLKDREPEAVMSDPGLEGEAETESDCQTAETAHEFVRTSQELWRAGAIDGAVDALDRAYELLLSLPDGEDPLSDRQKADLRNLIARRLVEIQAARRTSSGDLGGSIPLTVNAAVEREIRSFQGSERDFFTNSWRRSGRQRPMILEALRAAGLPDQLSWLPLIESGFQTRALSSARALGLWQFIPSTGWRFGLERDAWKDERMDPAKSTRAAIAYFTELHGLFGDWLTALAGYNCGENAVLRLINAQKIGWIDQFWDLNARLPNETARYVPRFIATLLIVSDPGKYGFERPELSTPVGVEVAETARRMRLEDIDLSMGLPAGTLAELNPELRLRVTPEGGYPLKIPAGAGADIVARLVSVPEYTAVIESKASGAVIINRPSIRQKTTYRSRSPILIHTVRRGETLTKIAGRYRTTVEQIRRDSRLRGKRLLVGQRLVIRVWSTGTVRVASRAR